MAGQTVVTPVFFWSCWCSKVHVLVLQTVQSNIEIQKHAQMICLCRWNRVNSVLKNWPWAIPPRPVPIGPLPVHTKKTEMVLAHKDPWTSHRCFTFRIMTDFYMYAYTKLLQFCIDFFSSFGETIVNRPGQSLSVDLPTSFFCSV